MLGVITGAHGVRGEVKVKAFTAEPRALMRYGALADEPGTRSFDLTVRGMARDLVIARIAGVDVRLFMGDHQRLLRRGCLGQPLRQHDARTQQTDHGGSRIGRDKHLRAADAALRPTAFAQAQRQRAGGQREQHRR